LEQGGHTGLQGLAGHPGKVAVELEQGRRGEIAGKRLVLVHVADAGERAPLGKRLSQAQDVARGRAAQSQQDLDEGGFAGPVGAQEREDFARLDREGHAAQGLYRPRRTQRRPVRLAHIDELRHRSRHDEEAVQMNYRARSASKVALACAAGSAGNPYLISAICTPLCKMSVKLVTMLVDICASVPVI